MHAFGWQDVIPGMGAMIHVYWAVLASLVILYVAFRTRKAILAAGNNPVPDRNITMRNVMEVSFEAIFGLMRDIIGHNYHRYIPFVGTVALFIFFSNMMGLIPGFAPPTDNYNVTLGLAVLAFLYYNYCGIREHGFAYVKQFLGPVWWLAPLMLPIELISHFARILSLSVRLFGNMFADHMVLAIFLGLVPLLVPLPIMLLGLIVAVVQTLIFVVLSIVYIGLAVSHEH